MKAEGVELGVAHAKSKDGAEKKAFGLIRKGYRVEIRPVGRGTGAWEHGDRWIIEWYTSYNKRR
jgi:hypothetical protein